MCYNGVSAKSHGESPALAPGTSGGRVTLSVVPIDGPPGPDVSLVASAVLDRSPKGIAAAVHRLIRAVNALPSAPSA